MTIQHIFVECAPMAPTHWKPIILLISVQLENQWLLMKVIGPLKQFDFIEKYYIHVYIVGWN